MDEIIYQSNNQNSVYVLNSNYRSYEDYACLKFIDPNDVNNKNMSNYQDSSAARSGSRCCSAATHTMQHKLHNLGKFCEITEIIGNAVTSPPSLSAAAATTATMSTTTTTPPARRCLSPAPAFQNFFNCSYVTNASGGNSAKALHNNGSTTGGGVDVTRIKPNNGNKKKCANIKPSLMAKKTKFRKFIEEEKWKACEKDMGEHVHQCSTSNNDRVACTGSVTPTDFRTNSCVKESNAADSTTLTASMAAMATCGSLNNIVKHYWNGKMNVNAAGESKRHQHRNESNNWSGSSDSNNQHRQQQLEVLKSSRQQKSNYELYKEAAELLGLSCTLCDNCRCLECQSTYFDCDDSDSFSELSNSDEFDEEMLSALNNSVELVMYANCYRDDTISRYDTVSTRQQTASQFQHKQLQSSAMYADANCNASNMLDNDQYNHGNENGALAFAHQADAIKHKGLPTSEQQCQRNSVLENFTSFNQLRLTDDQEESFLGTENGKEG